MKDTQSELKQSTTSGQTFDSVLTKEVDCPDCFKQHTGTDYRYIDIYHGADVVAHVALGAIGDSFIIHGVVDRWSKESFKAIKTGFYGVIIPGAKDLGMKKIVVVDRGVDDKLIKFLKMLNFSDPVNLTYLELEI